MLLSLATGGRFHFSVKPSEKPGELAPCLFGLVLGLFFQGKVDHLTIDLSRRTYQRRGGFLRWITLRVASFEDLAKLRLHGSTFVSTRWYVSLVFKDSRAPTYMVAVWYTRPLLSVGAHARVRAKA